MNIIWYGQSCFKLSSSAKNLSGEPITLITDPFDKSIGLNPPRTSADIVTVSHQHHDHNNVAAIKGEPFVVDGPGEYEIKGVTIEGIPSFHDKKQGAERGDNTIYVIKMDEIKICHLGDLGHSLTDKQMEKIDGIDILMIPVGGNFTISWDEADSVINQVEPRIVIPMHYHLPGLKIKLDPVDKFCKEMGVSAKETVSKISLKKKDLPQEKTEVMVMGLK